MTRLTFPRRFLATAALAVALPLLAWGCGSASESTTETTRAASTSCPSSVYRCVLVAFTNDLQEAVTVRADGKELGMTTLELAPGASGVIRGWSSGALAKFDIEGSLNRVNEPTAQAYFQLMNPSVGRPCMGVAVKLTHTMCPGASQPGSSSHTVMTSDVGWAKVNYQREPDTTNFVQFVARILPTT